jgi:hypothetical protein
MRDRYETIEEFLNNDFSNINPLAPKLDTKISNIKWNKNGVKLLNKVATVSDLIEILSGDITVTKTSI